MNHGTTVALNADPNGDMTITNLDGTITIHKDGTVTLATTAPIELAGASLAKLDAPGLDPKAAIAALGRRTQKR